MQYHLPTQGKWSAECVGTHRHDCNIDRTVSFTVLFIFRMLAVHMSLLVHLAVSVCVYANASALFSVGLVA